MKLNITKIGSFSVYYRNLPELQKIKKHLFEEEEYYFKSKRRDPNIIDCGSHIGLAILYFKSIYPDSSITGFEPNIDNFKILKKNIRINNLRKVKVIHAALSDKVGLERFWRNSLGNGPWTWGDTIISGMQKAGGGMTVVRVKGVKLSDYIVKPVDLLKLDIEGAEQKVLSEIEKKLYLVNKIIMEFHGSPNIIDINNYQSVKNLLNRNSFTVKTISKGIIFDLIDFIKKLRKKNYVLSLQATKVP